MAQTNLNLFQDKSEHQTLRCYNILFKYISSISVLYIDHVLHLIQAWAPWLERVWGADELRQELIQTTVRFH